MANPTRKYRFSGGPVDGQKLQLVQDDILSNRVYINGRLYVATDNYDGDYQIFEWTEIKAL